MLLFTSSFIKIASQWFFMENFEVFLDALIWFNLEKIEFDSNLVTRSSVTPCGTNNHKPIFPKSEL
jgi:hypothetical protein